MRLLAALVAPALTFYRRKHHGRRRYQHFCTAALERCLNDERCRA